MIIKQYWREGTIVILFIVGILIWVYSPVEPRRKYEKEKKRNEELQMKLDSAYIRIDRIILEAQSSEKELIDFKNDLHQTVYGLMVEFTSSEDEANRIISRNVPDLIDWYKAMRDSSIADRKRLLDRANAIQGADGVLGQ